MTNDDGPSDMIRAMFDPKPAELYRTTVEQLRFVLAGRPDEPWPAWSTGEWLAVALALNDVDRLAAEYWTIEQATQRVADGWNLRPEQVRPILLRAHTAAIATAGKNPAQE
jgi:hypothetical protein